MQMLIIFLANRPYRAFCAEGSERRHPCTISSSVMTGSWVMMRPGAEKLPGASGWRCLPEVTATHGGLSHQGHRSNVGYAVRGAQGQGTELPHVHARGAAI